MIEFQIEIKRVLESLYGFEVEKVETLNMEGKKKKRGGILLAKPDYKKAYVTLKHPLSISPDLFPIRVIEDDKRELNKQSTTSYVEEGPNKQSHWLEGDRTRPDRTPRSGANHSPRPRREPSPRPLRRGGLARGEETAKFPWTSMRNNSGTTR